MLESYNSALANRLGALALAVGDRITDAAEAATGTRGGVPAALVCLHEWADGCSVAVLAGAMRVTHSRAVRIVDQLEADGLARRGRSEDDGRRAAVHLTPRGHTLARRALEARAAVLSALIAEVDEPYALDRALASLLAAVTTDGAEPSAICRLCDAHECGHYDGRCPVTKAAAAARVSE